MTAGRRRPESGGCKQALKTADNGTVRQRKIYRICGNLTGIQVYLRNASFTAPEKTSHLLLSTIDKIMQELIVFF